MERTCEPNVEEGIALKGPNWPRDKIVCMRSGGKLEGSSDTESSQEARRWKEGRRELHALLRKKAFLRLYSWHQRQPWIVFSVGAGTWTTAPLTGGSSKGPSSSLLGSVPRASVLCFIQPTSLGPPRGHTHRKHDSKLVFRTTGFQPGSATDSL